MRERDPFAVSHPEEVLLEARYRPSHAANVLSPGIGSVPEARFNTNGPRADSLCDAQFHHPASGNRKTSGLADLTEHAHDSLGERRFLSG
jgi:hypothetical protein